MNIIKACANGIYNLLKKPYLLWLFNHKQIESQIIWFFSSNRKKNQERLLSYKNKHLGERCFIVCNGPSLRKEDLEMIEANGDISFGCNHIDKIFPKTTWRPTYYTMLDHYAIFLHPDTINAVPGVHFYRKNSYLATRKVKSPCLWMNTNGSRKLLDDPKFSKDCDEIIYTIGTVTYGMLQLAAYMGFKDVYIIGCDNTFGVERKKDGTIVKNNVESHFKEATEKESKNLGNGTWEMNIAYESARKFADSRNDFNIYNATRGGRLEAFERVDFDSLFKR